MANTGLNVGDVVNINVVFSPAAAATLNFAMNLIVGDSDVIDVVERMRLYTSLEAVGADFGDEAPEYEAADIVFQQNPQPSEVYIGRWAATATSGVLQGGALSSAQQAIENWVAVTNGGVDIAVDGTNHPLSGLNFSAASNLNAVAAILQTALDGAATVTWDAPYANFVVQSATTGNESAVGFATAGAGTDISTMLGLTAAAGAYVANGIVAETLLTCCEIMQAMTNFWYGFGVGADAVPADADYVNTAASINGASLPHIFWVTTQEGGVLSAESTTDLASLLKAGGYKRTFCQYSSQTQDAALSPMALASTVDFDESDSTLTLMFKTLPGVTPETLTESQANPTSGVLASKNCNVYVAYNNGVPILQNGVMSDGTFFDVIQGADWLQNALQTAVFNKFYTSNKVPQTDPGVESLLLVMTAIAEEAVENGYIAPGVWNGPPVGSLNTGDTLGTGYYFYCPPVSSQTEAQRQTRITPPIQGAVKLSGAFHFANVTINANP